MDAEALERLLIDRELGELDGDCALLLDAYVAAHDDAREAAAYIRRTLHAARTALGSSPVSLPRRLPPLRIAVTLKPTVWWSRESRRIAPLAVAAAVIALALMWPGAESLVPREHRPVRSIETDLESRVESNVDGFWSLPRLRQWASAGPARPARDLEWTSPLRWPVRGDKS